MNETNKTYKIHVSTYTHYHKKNSEPKSGDQE